MGLKTLAFTGLLSHFSVNLMLINRFRMARFLLVFSFVLFCLIGKAQVSCPTEQDHLTGQVIFVFKGGATPAQLNTIKSEFAKYPQITKASYVYTSINYLLVELDMN